SIKFIRDIVKQKTMNIYRRPIYIISFVKDVNNDRNMTEIIFVLGSSLFKNELFSQYFPKRNVSNIILYPD
ncbi:hypothetical protein ACFL4S_01320, partial [bacterium]